jgi:endonuclease/exonuclease/phosphatase family metal-dependent hydrolase
MNDIGNTEPAGRRALRWVLGTTMATATVVIGGVTTPAATATAAPVAERATEHSIRVITYNVGNKKPKLLRAQLGRLMALEPAVIGLQEVADREGLLSDVARRNKEYRLWYEAVGTASKHNAILVRGEKRREHGARVISGWTKVHDSTPGTGDVDMVPPKYLNWLKLKVDGLKWVFGTVHLVAAAERAGDGYAPNRALLRREVARSADWFKSRTSEPILVGDFNATLNHRYNLLRRLKDVAKPWTKPSLGNRAIDIVWTAKNAKGKVRALDGFGGDHRPVLADITVTR